MSYQALYRKWRPSTFDEMIGQDAVVTTLKNQVKSDRIGHAYLFCGTRGTGKTSAAKILARAVNCPHAAEHDGNPCNACPVCEGIRTGREMNVFEIDAASNNGVENIRDIRDQVEYPPVSGRFKVYIIDEVHMLSPGAFNALLKTLEEPPAYVIFILATTDPQKIPQTIRSRCQRYDFRRVSRRVIASHLREIAALEGLQIEDSALSYIAEAGDGSVRDSLSLLDQCAGYHYGQLLTYENVLEILGAADLRVYSELYGQIVRGETEAALTTVGTQIAAGCDVSQMITDFIWYLRNVLLAGSTASADVLDLSEDRLAMARADAALADRQELVTVMSAMAELGNRARFSPQKRVLLEVELIRLCLRQTAGGQNTGQAGRMAGIQTGGAAAVPASGQAAAGGPLFPGESVYSGAGPVPVGTPTGTSAGVSAGTSGMSAASAGEEPSGKDSIDPAASGIPRRSSLRERLLAGREQSGQAPSVPMSAKITVDLRDRREMPAAEPAEDRFPANDGADPGADGNVNYAADEVAGAGAGEAEAAGQEERTSGDTGERLIDILRLNWESFISELAPSNRTLFAGVVLKEEKGGIILLFKNKINYTLAARNSEENGVLRLREIARERLGRPVVFNARIANPGEIEAVDNRMTDEELSRINFKIDFEP